LKHTECAKQNHSKKEGQKKHSGWRGRLGPKSITGRENGVEAKKGEAPSEKVRTEATPGQARGTLLRLGSKRR